jgi:AcrR family transcriptional regulator
MAERNEVRRTGDGRRQVIIEAAARVFAEKGFSGASNREIAREADISPGLIYWYFRDKDELFTEAVRSLFPLTRLEFPDERAAELALHDLLEFIGQHFMSIMTDPDVLRLARLAISELITFPNVWREIGSMIAENAIGRLGGQLDLRIERGEMPPIDTHLASQAFFGSLMAFVLRKYMYQSVDLQETADEEMVATTVRIFAAGLIADAGSGTPEHAIGDSTRNRDQ